MLECGWTDDAGTVRRRMHNAGMPSITIRHVPADVRDELAARAGRMGRSLQERLHAELIDLAARPSAAELMNRVRTRKSHETPD